MRTDEQATAIRQYNVEPLRLSSTDEAEVHSTIVSLGITIIFYLINAARSEGQVTMIKALGEVRRRRAAEVDAVHFLHTTGAKVFSSHAGAPTDRPLLDTDANLYAVQKSQRAPFPLMQGAVDTNNTVIEQGELHGVRAYIFAPCIVYGRNEGFGNPISIQTVAIVEAAKAVRRVYRVDEGRPSWPVCHVVDNATLYLALLRRILDDARQGGDEKDSQVLGYGKDGYYLASSGSVAWNDLYAAMGKRLAEKNVIDDAEVVAADDDALDKMAAALACPKDFVPVQLGGRYVSRVLTDRLVPLKSCASPH